MYFVTTTSANPEVSQYRGGRVSQSCDISQYSERRPEEPKIGAFVLARLSAFLVFDTGSRGGRLHTARQSLIHIDVLNPQITLIIDGHYSSSYMGLINLYTPKLPALLLLFSSPRLFHSTSVPLHPLHHFHPVGNIPDNPALLGAKLPLILRFAI